MTENRLCHIDFEFNSTSEQYLNLVSCSTMLHTGKRDSFWLHNDRVQQKVLVKYLQALNEDGYIFVAYAASAEARSFIALGLKPLDFRWIDLYAEWLQARYNNDLYEYGRYLHKVKVEGVLVECKIRRSVAPSMDPKLNKGKDNTPTGKGMADCVANMLGILIDTNRKEKVRNLIISNPPKFTADEAAEIMEYCDSDLDHLPDLMNKLANNIYEVTKKTRTAEDILDIMVTRGEYAAAVAHFETVGIPQDMPAVRNLSRNCWNAVDALVKKLHADHYQFFEITKKNKRDLRGKWSFKYKRFVDFLLEHDLLNQWPLTDPTDRNPMGQYKSDNNTLDDYGFIPEIEALRQTMKSIKNLNWFRPEAFKGTKDRVGFEQKVGPDNRLRTFYGIFGTQTGRNAPPASSYTFAMANWLRCTIRPEKGWAITGIDYKSQEFLVAGIMSKDQNMIDAYRTGDPYTAFAKMAGAIPPDGDKSTHPDIRDLYKACALGMLYGMGRDALYRRVKASRKGLETLKRDTDKLYDNHKKVFKVFWKWTAFIEEQYKYKEYLILNDGWMLGPHCASITSVKNWPVQGMGGCIMRNAAVEATRRGLDIVSPLHDAIYILHRVEDKESPKLLAEVMYNAVEEFIPGADIGLDEETHDHDHIWVEGRSKAYYESVKKYLEWHPTDAETEQQMRERIYGNS